MNLKSSMQMLNLGLSIFSKVQHMQHRQIKMAASLRSDHARRSLTKSRRDDIVQETELSTILEPRSI